MIDSSFPLLVFGAGAAGMNAALLAARSGIHSTVVEKTNRMFSTISKAWWRQIDPTEYDWPHGHWNEGLFPLPGTGTIPLQQKRATGPALASAWDAEWSDFNKNRNGRGLNGKISVVRKLDAHNLRFTDDNPTHLEVKGPWDGEHNPETTKKFGALLSCVGFGEEQVGEYLMNGKWKGYKGPAFWHDSDGIAPGSRLPRGISNVVISGGGDGGMQDFQRVATSYFGRDLYLRYLEAAGSSLKLRTHVLPSDTLLKNFLSAEDAGRRAFGWASDRLGVPDALSAWHEAFADPIDDLVRHWSRFEVNTVADTLFRQEVLDGSLKITWLLRESTPGYAYALNRYLVLLLLAVAKRHAEFRNEDDPGSATNPFTVLPSSSIHTIDPINHICSSAKTCIGEPHHVSINVAGEKSPRTIPHANLIVVRHGVTPRREIFPGPLVPEQIVPFTLPG
jgi:hypothetical protein